MYIMSKGTKHTSSGIQVKGIAFQPSVTAGTTAATAMSAVPATVSDRDCEKFCVALQRWSFDWG